ncbi:MAG: DUF4397 domain-containing protein [Acidimicrobiia bacterium]
MKRIITVFAMALMVMAFAIPASAQTAARIHLIHGIPGAVVDVYVAGDPVFENFEYSQTQDLSALAGAELVDLQVRLSSDGTVVIDAGNVTLPAEGNFTIIAQYDEAGVPGLGIFQNDVSSIAAGEGRLTVRHAAAAPAVNVRAGEPKSVVFPDVVNTLSNAGEGTADLPVDTYNVDVVVAADDSVVAFGPADIAVADGESLIVYATGQASDGLPLPILTETISGLGETPEGVPTGNSPVESAFPVAGMIAAVAIAGTLAFGLTVSRKNG